MAKDLHKGIQLDDKFSKAEQRLQKVIQDLEMIHDDFRDYEVTVVSSQTNRLDSAAERIKELCKSFKALKAK